MNQPEWGQEHDSHGTLLGPSCMVMQTKLQALADQFPVAERNTQQQLFHSARSLVLFLADICGWDKVCNPEHIVQAREYFHQAFDLLEYSIYRIRLCSTYAEFEYYAEQIEQEHNITVAPNKVKYLHIHPKFDVDLTRAFQEFGESPNDYPNLGLRELFQDVVMQVKGYHLCAMRSTNPLGQIGDLGYTFEAYFANGLRIHLPQGELIYDEKLESSVSVETAAVFQQIHEWLRLQVQK